jgi:hypothetical protein
MHDKRFGKRKRGEGARGRPESGLESTGEGVHITNGVGRNVCPRLFGIKLSKILRFVIVQIN